MIRRSASIPGAVAVGAVLAVVSLGVGAWACTAFTSLKGTQVGIAGSPADVEGESLVRSTATSRTVFIRWNGLNGPVLAELDAADNGSLHTRVTVPSVAPGFYYMVAMVDGRAVARMPFQVTSPSRSDISSELVAGRSAPHAESVASGGHGATRLGTDRLPVMEVLEGTFMLGLLAAGMVLFRSGRRQPATFDGSSEAGPLG